MKRLALSIGILPLLLSARLPAQQSETLVLRNVTVIDGTGRAPQPNRNIVIVDGLISEITSASTAAPTNARVLDLSGRFVIPGLVDAHVHVTSPLHIPEQQDSMLAFLFDSGITTVRDLAGDAIMLRERAELAKSSTLPSPRIFYSALMAGDNFVRTEPRAAPIARGGVPGDVAWLKAVTESTDLAKAVTAAKETGATAVKIYADLDASLVQRVTAEAHRQGMKVWAYAVVVPARPREVVAAGADVISHMQYLVYEANDQLPASVRSIRGMANYSLPVNGPIMTKLLQSIKEHGTMLDGTLVQVEFAGVRAELDPERPDLHPMRSWSYAIARRAHELGIPLVSGTDLMGRPGIDSLSYLHTDIELLVKQVGMTPVQAISAATLNGARSVGREREQGTIEPGKIADLVVLAADPTADIRNTRGILYVIKAGEPHKRALADHIRALATARSTPGR